MTHPLQHSPSSRSKTNGVVKPDGDRSERAKRNGPVKGFSLLELIAMLAVVAILAGVVAPMLGHQVAGAEIDAAEADVAAIAQAMSNFHMTTGQWPSKDANGRDDGIWMLISGTQKPARNPWRAGHAFWSWARGARGDVLGHHLITNTPGGQVTHRYATTSKRPWRGPYLDSVRLDPWGHPYAINVVSAHSTHTTNYRRLWVLSAGPDGRWQTSANATTADDVQGDDIGFLVRQR
ncbi:MAG: type II secretion system protein GspG [Planctomycetota bacterium]